MIYYKLIINNNWYYIPWFYIHYRPIILNTARLYKDRSLHPELLNLGKAIRSIRLDKGISQEALADISGIDRSYMGGIERGEHNLALINMKRIANALEITISALMNKSGL